MSDPSTGRPEGHDERDAALAELLVECVRGDGHAFELFYKATARRTLVAVRGIAGSAYAEDVLADAYLQAWRDCHRFDPARGSALAWLLTIARSRAMDRLRQEVLRHGGLAGAPEHDGDDDAGTALGPEQLLEGLQDRTRVRDLMGQLPPRERWVLSLAYFRELTQTEIASETGMPLGTVKSLMTRAQHKLRAAMGPGS